MSDRTDKINFMIGVAVMMLGATIVTFITIALLRQSWQLGLGAIGFGLAAFFVLFAVSGMFLRRARLADEAEKATARLDERYIPAGRQQCQKPIYGGHLSAPVPCADDDGHDGHCTP